MTAGSFAIVVAVSAAPTSDSDSLDAKPDAMPVDELKRVYLSCNRAAMGSQLDTPGIMQCSVVYEQLKLRAFGGDFEKLRAWSKAQSSIQKTAH